MAKQCLIEKQKKTPSSRFVRTTAASVAAVVTLTSASSAFAVCASANSLSPVSSPV